MSKTPDLPEAALVFLLLAGALALSIYEPRAISTLIGLALVGFLFVFLLYWWFGKR